MSEKCPEALGVNLVAGVRRDRIQHRLDFSRGQRTTREQHLHTWLVACWIRYTEGPGPENGSSGHRLLMLLTDAVTDLAQALMLYGESLCI